MCEKLCVSIIYYFGLKPFSTLLEFLIKFMHKILILFDKLVLFEQLYIFFLFRTNTVFASDIYWLSH